MFSERPVKDDNFARDIVRACKKAGVPGYPVKVKGNFATAGAAQSAIPRVDQFQRDIDAIEAECLGKSIPRDGWAGGFTGDIGYEIKPKT